MKGVRLAKQHNYGAHTESSRVKASEYIYLSSAPLFYMVRLSSEVNVLLNVKCNAYECACTTLDIAL